MAATPLPRCLRKSQVKKISATRKNGLCVVWRSGISRPIIRRHLIGSVPKIFYQIVGMHKRLRTEARRLSGRLPHELIRSQTNEPKGDQQYTLLVLNHCFFDLVVSLLHVGCMVHGRFGTFTRYHDHDGDLCHHGRKINIFDRVKRRSWVRLCDCCHVAGAIQRSLPSRDFAR